MCRARVRGVILYFMEKQLSFATAKAIRTSLNRLWAPPLAGHLQDTTKVGCHMNAPADAEELFPKAAVCREQADAA
jgi:hypothetical protein